MALRKLLRSRLATAHARGFAVRALPPLGAPCLRDVAKPVPEAMFGTPALDAIVADLVDTMRDANGAGIAGPQIGEGWRIFVVEGSGANPRYPYKPKLPLTVFVNPELEVVDEAPMEIFEGCLSIPGVRGRVARASKVRCAARRPDGSSFGVLAAGHAAGTLQHEQDHLDGILFPDIATPGGLVLADAFDEYHRDAFFAYAAALNDAHPEPWVVEAAPGPAVAASTTTRYAPTLTWTGAAFERDVVVAVDAAGRVASVERGRNDGARLPGAVLPGFVNAHSHAFQRGLRGRGETYALDDAARPSFWTWREAMRGRPRPRKNFRGHVALPRYDLVEGLDSVEAFRAETLACFREMAAAGITTVGEFHYFRHGPGRSFEHDFAVVDAAREANVRVVLLAALYERGGFDGEALGPGQRRFASGSLEAYWAALDRLAGVVGDAEGTRRGDGLGVVAHSLRAVAPGDVAALAAGARNRGLPFHLHIEEQPKEVADCLKTHGVTPMRLLLDHADVGRATAVHCTHTDPADLEAFLAAGGRVCVCPLTEASLGDGAFGPLDASRGAVSLGAAAASRPRRRRKRIPF